MREPVNRVRSRDQGGNRAPAAVRALPATDSRTRRPPARRMARAPRARRGGDAARTRRARRELFDLLAAPSPGPPRPRPPVGLPDTYDSAAGAGATASPGGPAGGLAAAGDGPGGRPGRPGDVPQLAVLGDTLMGAVGDEPCLLIPDPWPIGDVEPARRARRPATANGPRRGTGRAGRAGERCAAVPPPSATWSRSATRRPRCAGPVG
ncbi:hypothetical protein NKH77_06710 [Streptomyces sp. M19]